MDIVVLSIVGTPLLVGMALMIWGLRSMRRHLLTRVETFPHGPGLTRMALGSLSVGMFFPMDLAAARVPLGLEAAIIIALSLLLIIVGELVIRSALLSLRGVPPGLPWLVFLGMVMLTFLPILIIATMKLPTLLGKVIPFVWIMLDILSFQGQSLLMKHWQRIGERRATNRLENL